MIDSEPVPWGKGEKNPGEGSEIELKPYAYKEPEPEHISNYVLGDGVPIEEWSNEFLQAVWVSLRGRTHRETEC